jgi:pyruvate dehydrogenase E2 component (dihydrolipoamide acetyltransferase)
MAMEIRLPALGENIDSATVTKVLVKIGDTIKKDQPIMELDTEKASVDVPSSAAGTIKEIRVKEGDTINVGQVVLTLEESGETAVVTEPEKKPAPPPSKVEPEKNAPVQQKQEVAPPPPQPVEANQAKETKETPVREESLEKVSEPAEEGVPAAPSLRRMARELVWTFTPFRAQGPMAGSPRKMCGTTLDPSF